MVNLLDIVKWAAIVLAIVALVTAVAFAAGTISGLSDRAIDEFGYHEYVQGDYFADATDRSMTQDLFGAVFYSAGSGIGVGPAFATAVGGMFALIFALGLGLMTYRFLRQILS